MKLLAYQTLLVGGLSLCDTARGSIVNGGGSLRKHHRRGLKKGKAGKASKNSPKASKKSKNGGAVYTLSNANENHLIAFARDAGSGALEFVAAVPTDGSGATLNQTGAEDPLASQDSVVLSEDCVLGVNAGSHTVASFRIGSDGVTPTRVGTYPSNGFFPVSLAAKDDGLVYVLNAGENGSLSGYTMDHRTCELSPIAGSTVELAQATGLVGDEPPFFAASPAQIGFTPGGNLLVTIKAQDNQDPPATGTGSINEYAVDPETGLVDGDSLVQTNVTEGTIPFSFDFDSEGNLILVEAFGDQPPLTPNTGALTTYDTTETTPTLVQREDTGGTATCWVRYAEKSGCAFTTNNGGTISSFAIGEGGSVALVASVAAELAAPIDLDLSRDENFLYALATGHDPNTDNDDEQPSIYAYEIGRDCALVEIQVVSEGLPGIETSGNGVVGLASR